MSNNLFVPGDDRAENVDRNGEDDGAVVLRRDAAQGLEVPQLIRMDI